MILASDSGLMHTTVIFVLVIYSPGENITSISINRFREERFRECSNRAKKFAEFRRGGGGIGNVGIF